MWEGGVEFLSVATPPPTCPNKSAPSLRPPSSLKDFACRHQLSLGDKKKAVFFLTLTQDYFPLPHLQDSLNIWPYASLLGYGLMDCYR